MDPQLKNDHASRGEILKQTLEVVEKHFAREASLPPGISVPDVPLHALPEEGEGALGTLRHFEAKYAPLITNSAGPRYFGFVTGGSTPASVAADWLVSAYDQNAFGSNDSIAPQIEHQTIHYFKQLFGLHIDYSGSFVTGATMSNFVGLALARQWAGEQQGIDFSNQGLGSVPFKVLSGTPHASIIKCLSMLGIGRDALHSVNTLTDREAVDLHELEKFLADQTGPVIVVANAGTVNTGDFDDLMALGNLKSKYNFWLHTDAAFGGFAACSEKFRHLMAGINYSDSITIDAHKWLNVPYEAAMQFTRHRSLQLKVFQNSAAYLGDAEKCPDFFHYTPENSRRWRALPSWFTLRAYGKKGYREIVERNCALATFLGEKIRGSGSFSLLSPVWLNVACFTVNNPGATPDIIKGFLDALRDDGKVFLTPTRYKGVPAIRAAVSNWQTQPRDIEIAFEAITAVWSSLQMQASTAKHKTF